MIIFKLIFILILSFCFAYVSLTDKTLKGGEKLDKDIINNKNNSYYDDLDKFIPNKLDFKLIKGGRFAIQDLLLSLNHAKTKKHLKYSAKDSNDIEHIILLKNDTKPASGSYQLVDNVLYTNSKLNSYYEVIVKLHVKNEIIDVGKYNDEKKSYDYFIPTLLSFGKIKIEDTNYSYGLYPIYKLTKTLHDKPTYYKMIFIESLLDSLNSIKKDKKLVPDLKTQNIGYNNKFQCVLIDYDNGAISTFDPNKHLSLVSTLTPIWYYLYKSGSNIPINQTNYLNFSNFALLQIILNVIIGFNVFDFSYITNLHNHSSNFYKFTQNIQLVDTFDISNELLIVSKRKDLGDDVYLTKKYSIIPHIIIYDYEIKEDDEDIIDNYSFFSQIRFFKHFYANLANQLKDNNNNLVDYLLSLDLLDINSINTFLHNKTNAFVDYSYLGDDAPLFYLLDFAYQFVSFEKGYTDELVHFYLKKHLDWINKIEIKENKDDDDDIDINNPPLIPLLKEFYSAYNKNNSFDDIVDEFKLLITNAYLSFVTQHNILEKEFDNSALPLYYLIQYYDIVFNKKEVNKDELSTMLDFLDKYPVLQKNIKNMIDSDKPVLDNSFDDTLKNYYNLLTNNYTCKDLDLIALKDYIKKDLSVHIKEPVS